MFVGRLRDKVPEVNKFVVPRIAQTVVDTTNPRSGAEFWRRLLGLAYREGQKPSEDTTDDSAGPDWLNLLTPDGTPGLAFQRVDVLNQAT